MTRSNTCPSSLLAQRLTFFRDFTGKERDAETGLDFFEARYFSGAQGRFLSVDPENAGAKKDDPQSWNAYAYSRNNPLIYTDPDGKTYQLYSNSGSMTLADADFNNYYWGRYQFSNGSTLLGGSFMMDGVLWSYKHVEDVPLWLLEAIYKWQMAGNYVSEQVEKCESNPLCGIGMAGLMLMEGRADSAEAQGTKLLSSGIKNKKLLNIIKDLWKEGAKFGDGSTMDAARYEIETGNLIGGRNHVWKLIGKSGSEGYRKGLMDLLHNPNLDPGERKVVRQILIEIQNSLSGPRKQ